MRRFLYFLPGLPGANAGMLAERGLLNRFTSSGSSLLEHCITPCMDGPAGGGCIVALGQRPAAYEPGSQRWIQGEKCWVGIEDAPPRPDDLVREICIKGSDCILGDSESWRVPIIRRWADGLHVPNLPQRMVPAIRDGRPTVEFKIRPEFLEVDAIAGRVMQAFIDGAAVPFETLFADAVAILAVNYRIGPEEAGLLGILEEKAAVEVLSIAIDRAAIEARAMELAGTGVEYSDPVIEEE